jgi:hypothetical protein
MLDFQNKLLNLKDQLDRAIKLSKQAKVYSYWEWQIPWECKSYTAKLLTLEDKYAKWH